jgi:hypothetical protein
MTEKIETTDTNTQIMYYTFRFGTSDKFVHLTQQQLDSIPYLTALVAHEDDISSIVNENGEYVLNPPIHYHQFMIIVRSITLDQPYILFTDTSEDENILDILHLYEYLCINTLRVPILKGDQSVSSYDSDIDNGRIRIEYCKANDLETFDTAARFIIALSKNKYNSDDHRTVRDIFFLIKSIFSNSSVFDSRFRYHTLTIVKQCCFSLFSQKHQRQLPTSQQIINGDTRNDSLAYSYYDDQSPAKRYKDAFNWRAIYITTEEKEINRLLGHSNDNLCLKSHAIIWFDRSLPPITDHVRRIIYYLQCVTTVLGGHQYPIVEKERDCQAISARSGRFNTLPKRPEVDKCKPRSGPKAQKYR